MFKNLIFIFNCGSLFLKFVILDFKIGDEKLFGLVEVFYLEDVCIKWKLYGEKGNVELGVGVVYSEVLNFIVNELLLEELKVSIGVIGYCIVYGGEKFILFVVINDDVVKGIEEVI